MALFKKPELIGSLTLNWREKLYLWFTERGRYKVAKAFYQERRRGTYPKGTARTLNVVVEKVVATSGKAVKGKNIVELPRTYVQHPRLQPERSVGNGLSTLEWG
jgi:hypothetical protein